MWAARGVVVLGVCSALGAVLLALWFVAGRRFGWVPADPVAARGVAWLGSTDRVPQFTAVGMALLLPVLAGGAAIVVVIDQGWADGLAGRERRRGRGTAGPCSEAASSRCSRSA